MQVLFEKFVAILSLYLTPGDFAQGLHLLLREFNSRLELRRG